MDVNEIRKQFPALSLKVYGKPLVYLDNAATSQRPQSVIDCWEGVSVNANANIHRAVHKLAEDATTLYEEARETIVKFINAKSREEVVFTSGTTAAINLVAFSFGEAFVREGDEIIVSEEEHHSNMVPWQMLCGRKGATLKILRVDEAGQLKINELDALLTPKTKLVAVAHISNVLGIVNPVKEIVERCHAKKVPVLVDGAQGIVHQEVDVQGLDCDFYVFSGHKMYAAMGTGILYGKREWMDTLPPYMGGGEMIETVKLSGTTYAQSPMKFEAGTQNVSSAITFKTAVEYAVAFRDAKIRQNEAEITTYILDKLLNDKGIKLYGVPAEGGEKIPLFSFSVDGVHHEDLALVLDKMGIAVRSGQMCAEPLMDRFGVTGMLRASFAPYNTMQEAEYFVQSLDKAVKMLR